MKLFAAIRHRVKQDIIVRIHRQLKGKGTVSVFKGQEVVPSDIIGSAYISSGFRILKLAEELSVSASEVGRYMLKPLGQRMYKDELLAQKEGGIFAARKNITAPTDGILDYLNPKTGELRMTLMPKKVDLPSGVFGIVESVDSAKGQILIKTQVSRIVGMFGSGRVRDGILHVISKRDELVGKTLVSSKLDGQILAGGSLVFKDAIAASISNGVSGIIAGGLNARDYKGIAGGRLLFPKKIDTDIGISIVVCEGFGSIPMGEDIYEVLKKYNGRFVLIDGNGSVINLPSFDPNSIIKVRSTAFPPIQQENLTKYQRLDDHNIELKAGFRVRIVGNSFQGEQGKIIALDQTQTILPSGVLAYLATIETKRRKIQVPVANLEIIDYIH